ncbi:hypothetical protein [Haloechinothrix sp. LS1_15]|uniref:hypothetical protein n=1 Tax=Haloechinothrix sp. LS1_15 TaxID=2652248 RepID=UPI0029454928|nr:hypothetical protein [Haloechinothrix sp. LS1_15]MDV6013985.1 hypothetical protein [Haloechinothrix sp. LS1_15]
MPGAPHGPPPGPPPHGQGGPPDGPGPEGTRQYTQPGGFGPYGGPPPGEATAGYGGYPGYPGPYEGGPPGGEPPGRRKGVVIGVVIAAALLLVGGIVALILLFTGSDGTGEDDPTGQAADTEETADPDGTGADPGDDLPPEPDIHDPDGDGAADPGTDQAEVRQVAETAVAALNERDAELAQSVSCDPDAPTQEDLDELNDETFRITGEPVIEGNSARVPFEVTGTHPDTGEPFTENDEIPVQQRGGRWCIE